MGRLRPGRIVFFPRYFAMFDSCTTALFSQALGMSKYQFTRHYDFAGYPMVDTRARFLKPTKFGDDVVIETKVAEFRRSSFDVQHRLTLGGELWSNASTHGSGSSAIPTTRTRYAPSRSRRT